MFNPMYCLQTFNIIQLKKKLWLAKNGYFPDMGMGQNPGTFCEPQVIAGIYGCSSH